MTELRAEASSENALAAAGGQVRLHYLDALRGVAAMSVVLFHYMLDMVDQKVVGGIEAGFAAIIGDTLDLGKFGVALFFLISGYIIPNSLGSTGDRIGRFCVSRFFRLYPLYWIAVAAGVFLPRPHTDITFTSSAILSNLTMLQGYMGWPDIVGTAWTLQIELTFYGFCVVLAALHRLTSPRTCAIISAGFICMALIMAIARNLLVLKLPLALPIALSLMFFGTLWRQAHLVKLPGAKRLSAGLLILIVIFIVPVSVIGYNHDFGYHEHWNSYVACYLLALFTFVACTTRLPITWRPVVWLGEISYSLYLLHPLISSAAYRMGFVAPALGLDPLVYVTLLGGIAVACSWMTYRLIEQPFVKIGHRIVQTWRKRLLHPPTSAAGLALAAQSADTINISPPV
jgi:peptidoglycan/LPS O-acetylase OafA/YrhL